MSTASLAMTPANQAMLDMMAELQEFLNSIQRLRMTDAAWVQATMTRAQELQDRFQAARKTMAARSHEMSHSLDEMLDGLKEWTREFRQRNTRTRVKLATDRLCLRYEALAEQFRTWGGTAVELTGTVDPVKTVNYARNLFHVAMGVFAVFMYEFVLSWSNCRWVVVGLASIVVSLETIRRFKPDLNEFLVQRFFGYISRPHELHKTNGASYYVMALLVLMFIAPPVAVEVGVLMLAFADPAATLVGRRFGGRKLWKQKSVVGTLAFYGTAVAVGLVFLAIDQPQMAWAVRWGLVLTAALAGCLAELFTERLDDNFTIPIMAGGVAGLWLTFLS